MRSEDAKIVGMMLVRNEGWIIKASALIALRWVDELVIMDDDSEDETADLIIDVCRMAGTERVFYYANRRDDDPDVWREMELREQLRRHAEERNPTHYAIIDADEIPVAPIVPQLRRIVAECRPGEGISVPMHSPYHSTTTRRVDGSFEPAGGIFIGYRETPGSGWAPAGDGYQHHARCPQGVRNQLPMYPASDGGIMHMQFASKRRLEVKSAYYKALETIQYPGRMSPDELNKKYDWTLQQQSKQTKDIPAEWWEDHRQKGHATHIDLQREPWQLEALKRLIETYGTGPFVGLNMHGAFE